MAGFFTRKRLPNASAARAAEYMRLLNAFAGQSDVRLAMVQIAVPELPSSESRWPSNLGPHDADALIRRFAADQMSKEQLANAFFGRDLSYLQQDVLDRGIAPYSVTSEVVLDRIRSTEPSVGWMESITDYVPHPTIMEILGYSGNDGIPTHAGLPMDGWTAQDPHRFILQDAARVGFVSVCYPFGQSEGDFDVVAGSLAGRQVVGLAHTQSPYSTHPFHALPKPVYKAVRKRCRKLAHQLTHMYGERLSNAPGEVSESCDLFEEATYMAARLGAMVAAVVIDPSACKLFRLTGAPPNYTKTLLRVEEYPWIRDRDCQ